MTSEDANQSLETPPKVLSPNEVKRQQKIERAVAAALLRTAEIKRQVEEVENYFRKIKRQAKVKGQAP